MTVLLVAAGALLDGQGRVLLAKRPRGTSMAGLWEFPGGKIADGETPEAALIRELDEELGLEVEAAALTPLTFASHRYQDFHLLMPLFACWQWTGEPHPSEGQAIAWVDAQELGQRPMPPADGPLLPAVRALMES